MSIIHNITAPNGAPCSHFRVLGFEFRPRDSEQLKVQVGGWVSENDVAGGALPVYNWFVEVQPVALDVSQPISSLETALVQSSGSPWQGGTVVPTATPLAEAKVRRWALVKRQRLEHEASALTVPGIGVFDADEYSSTKILNAAQLVSELRARGVTNYVTDWTMYDDSVKSLTAEEIIAVAMAYGARVTEAHQTSRTLRAQIDAAQSVEELSTIGWPIPTPPAPQLPPPPPPAPPVTP